jgi:hypothetical protein
MWSATTGPLVVQLNGLPSNDSSWDPSAQARTSSESPLAGLSVFQLIEIGVRLERVVVGLEAVPVLCLGLLERLGGQIEEVQASR